MLSNDLSQRDHLSNLKDEIITCLKEHQKNQSDIIWAGSAEGIIDLKTFWRLADTEYNAGYGVCEVPDDLIVVGLDFWLERHEYDGLEWFEYKEQPTMPNAIIDAKWVTSRAKLADGYELGAGATLRALNDLTGAYNFSEEEDDEPHRNTQPEQDIPF